MIYHREKFVEKVWPEVKDWVHEAIGGDPTITVDDIKMLCIQEAADLWLMRDSDGLKGVFIGTTCEGFHGKYYMAQWFGGKDIRSWINKAYEELKAFAISNGCVKVDFISSPGLGKILDINPKGAYYSVIL